MRRLSIAATIVVVAGTGALAYKLRPGAAAFPVAEDSIAPPPDQVVSNLERTSAADTVARTVAPSVPRSDTPTSLAAAPERPALPAQKTVTPPPSREPAKAAAKPAPAPAADRRAAQGRTAAPTSPPPDTAPADSATPEVPETTAAQDAAVDSATDQDLADVRRRAAEALSQLDRDRRRNQAAAATAALDSARRARAATRAAATTVAPAAAAPAPAPPALTLEQRAGIYLRIGLDEASRQLGGPAHVIEGMSASFMGLAQGRGLGGADSTRPVVRVVYQDTQGRLVFLDQQRLRTGQAPPQGGLAWVAGETALWLRGEPPAEVLRSLRPRVR